jgi:glycerol-3-phosphate dehydrogenase
LFSFDIRNCFEIETFEQEARDRETPMADDRLYDVFVIGGGINGCGIARDAIGRGYSVFLAEMNDLASGTSSWSSKLIHGGFRYLEYYEFRLVREALSEREVLLSNAPHIIWPLRFVLPHHKEMRPAWLLRLGLFLYDHIGKRKLLPGTKPSTSRHRRLANRSNPCSPRGSNIPTVGSTMRVWWC